MLNPAKNFHSNTPKVVCLGFLQGSKPFTNREHPRNPIFNFGKPAIPCRGRYLPPLCC